jgi:flavodoxin
MPVYSFFDEYDLSGKEVVVYATHEGSRFSDTVNTITDLEPDAVVTEGLSVRGGEVSESEQAVRDSI